ncbi:hypothetical protein AURDEDRAFT_112247 [Auricularia subglabra TFB-10046 SS5]|nr:hypothetical protein AURDEDRAFT_112247 [Auricularia subglabra TFB-10046 SS5]
MTHPALQRRTALIKKRNARVLAKPTPSSSVLHGALMALSMLDAAMAALREHNIGLAISLLQSIDRKALGDVAAQWGDKHEFLEFLAVLSAFFHHHPSATKILAQPSLKDWMRRDRPKAVVQRPRPQQQSGRRPPDLSQSRAALPPRRQEPPPEAPTAPPLCSDAGHMATLLPTGPMSAPSENPGASIWIDSASTASALSARLRMGPCAGSEAVHIEEDETASPYTLPQDDLIAEQLEDSPEMSSEEESFPPTPAEYSHPAPRGGHAAGAPFAHSRGSRTAYFPHHDPMVASPDDDGSALFDGDAHDSDANGGYGGSGIFAHTLQQQLSAASSMLQQLDSALPGEDKTQRILTVDIPRVHWVDSDESDDTPSSPLQADTPGSAYPPTPDTPLVEDEDEWPTDPESSGTYCPDPDDSYYYAESSAYADDTWVCEGRDHIWDFSLLDLDDPFPEDSAQSQDTSDAAAGQQTIPVEGDAFDFWGPAGKPVCDITEDIFTSSFTPYIDEITPEPYSICVGDTDAIEVAHKTFTHRIFDFGPDLPSIEITPADDGFATLDGHPPTEILGMQDEAWGMQLAIVGTGCFALNSSAMLLACAQPAPGMPSHAYMLLEHGQWKPACFQKEESTRNVYHWWIQDGDDWRQVRPRDIDPPPSMWD